MSKAAARPLVIHSSPPTGVFSPLGGPNFWVKIHLFCPAHFAQFPSLLVPRSSYLGQYLLNFGFELPGVLKIVFSEYVPGRSLTVAALRRSFDAHFIAE
ncbi:MAG: hypothetical protein MI725_11885, partial [Pirellulales bacterium]|nr:hypothetical protein [Pirellulales bacterium]